VTSVAALVAGIACSDDTERKGTESPNEDPPAAHGELLVESVSGRVVDHNGEPLATGQVTVCGDQCFYGATDPSGNFLVSVNAVIPVDAYAVVPHVKTPLAAYYAPLVVPAAGKVTAPDLHILQLPTDGPDLFIKGEPQAAQAQSVSSGDVTLTIDAGITVVLSIDDKLLGAAGKKFRALKVPTELMAKYAPSALKLRAIYALGPFGASLKKAEGAAEGVQARLSFKNTLGLTAGQSVEVLAMDLEMGKPGHRPGTFQPVAKAAVSKDGALIEVLPTDGLTTISWVGLR
jgi:hypothetical protein